MASQTTKGKKRALPAWMTAMHESKQKQNATDEKQQNAGECSEAKKALKTIRPKSASEIISDSMPLLQVTPKVTYVFQSLDCACICDEIISSIDGKENVPVGFDMEWPVSFKRGSQNKTALIQMYFSSNESCYLFQVCGMNSLPKQLIKLIFHPNILLIGLNIESDLWKLERDFDIRVKSLIDRGSVIDVSKMANEKLKSSERWDLNGLCKNVLGVRLNKDFEIRGGNWTDIPLSLEQIAYSSADAYAGVLLFKKLTGDDDSK